MMKQVLSLKASLVLLLIGLSVAGFSQTTVVDITTGNASVGSNDPIWDVRHSTGSFANAKVANPHSIYATDPCGKWITPVLGSGNKPGNTTSGSWFYKLEFEYDIDPCTVTAAVIDIPFIAADNQLRGITLNGNAITVPTSPYIMLSPAGSINQSVLGFLVNGTNTLEVEVRNWNSSWGSQTATALQLCGDITITKECCTEIAPEDLWCDGQLLEWSDVPGALGYQIEINWNDPRCCEGGEPFSSLYTVWGGDSKFWIDEPFACCFSWRVRAICNEDGPTYGPWSDYSCCNLCQFKRAVDFGSGSQELPATFSVYPNPANGLFQVKLPETANFTYSIVDLQGRVVVDMVNGTSQVINLDLTEEKSGVYFLKIQINGEQRVERLLKY